MRPFNTKRPKPKGYTRPPHRPYSRQMLRIVMCSHCRQVKPYAWCSHCRQVFGSRTAEKNLPYR